MKDFCTFLLLLAITIGIGYLSFKDSDYFKPGVATDFKANAADLNGKSVSLPQGQIWGFNPDQNVQVQVLSEKAVDEVVVVTAELSATVKFPEDKDKKGPKKASLAGLAKLIYERINGSWYLTHIENVSLKLIVEA